MLKEQPRTVAMTANAQAASLGMVADASANKVLRDTYRLLSITLAFSALVAATSAVMRLPHPGLLLTLAGYFGLLFLTSHLRNSPWGLLSVFGLTGFMGYTLGPLIAAYLAVPGGSGIVTTAMGSTAAIFLALSWYARREDAIDMSRFGTFLIIGIITAFCLALAAWFLALPGLSLSVSGIFVLLMSGLIMYQTQAIVRGGETNYIMATVTLFVSIFNLFTSLMHLLGAFGGDEG